MFNKKKPNSYNIELKKSELVSVIAVGMEYYFQLINLRGKDYLIFDCFESLKFKNKDSDIRLDVALKVPLIHQYQLTGDKALQSEGLTPDGERYPKALLDFDNAHLIIHEASDVLYTLYRHLKNQDAGKNTGLDGAYDELTFGEHTIQYLQDVYTHKDQEKFNSFLQKVKTREYITTNSKWIQRYQKTSLKWFKH